MFIEHQSFSIVYFFMAENTTTKNDNSKKTIQDSLTRPNVLENFKNSSFEQFGVSFYEIFRFSLNQIRKGSKNLKFRIKNKETRNKNLK